MALEGGFFKGGKGLDDALEDAAKPGKEADDTTTLDADDEGEVNDLFTADEPAEGDEGDEGDAEPLFDKEEVEDSKDEKTVPLSRLQKVIKQRNEERSARATSDARADGLEEALASNKELVETIAEKYAGFKNPAAMLEFDADFMSAMEQVAKTDDSVATVASRVQEFMKTGEFKKVGAAVTEEKTTDDTTPAADPRIDAIIKRDAQTTIDAALQDLKPAFRGLIGKLITSNVDSDGLAGLDSTEVRAYAKKYISENGFEPGDVLLPTTGDEKPKGGATKPSTAGTGGKPGDGPAKPKGEKGDEPEAPKSVDEWEKNRAERLRSFSG